MSSSVFASMLLLSNATSNSTTDATGGMDALSITFSIMGTFTGLFLTFSPWSAITAVDKAKDLGKLSVYPFYSLFINSVAWVVYGALVPDYIIYLLNGISAVATFRYILVCYAYTASKLQFDIINTITVSIMLVLYALVSFIKEIQDPEVRITVVGAFASLCVVFVYGSPLLNIYNAIKLRSTASIPFLMGLSAVMNGSMWFVYGSLTSQPFVAGPNAVGVIVGIIQSILWIVLTGPRKIKYNLLNALNKIPYLNLNLTPRAELDGEAGEATKNSTVANNDSELQDSDGGLNDVDLNDDNNTKQPPKQ